MPENETLVFDARVASRWRPIGERLDKGESPTELFLEMQNQFYTSLQRAWKQWRGRGVDPDQLFDAALNVDLPTFRGRFEESVNSPERSEWHERFTASFYG